MDGIFLSKWNQVGTDGYFIIGRVVVLSEYGLGCFWALCVCVFLRAQYDYLLSHFAVCDYVGA